MFFKKRYLPTSFSGYLPDICRFQKKTSAPLGCGGAWAEFFFKSNNASGPGLWWRSLVALSSPQVQFFTSQNTASLGWSCLYLGCALYAEEKAPGRGAEEKGQRDETSSLSRSGGAARGKRPELLPARTAASSPAKTAESPTVSLPPSREPQSCWITLQMPGASGLPMWPLPSQVRWKH
jgi:hypothetical protein